MAIRILHGLFDDKTKSEPDATVRQADEIEAWFIERLAVLLDLPAADIDPRQPFADFGLDSRSAVSLSGQLEEWLGREVTPMLVWEYPNIQAAAAFLASDQATSAAATAESTAAFEPDEGH